MITGVTGVSDYVDASATATTKSKTLDKDSFLKLLLAQLSHQDPLNPSDPSQFASQLAQFSSLEQLDNINDSLTDMKDSQETGNKFQALDIIGKEIETSGNKLSIGDSGKATGSFTIDTAADCAVVISDANKNVIKTIDMEELKAGDHTFEWDGTNQQGTAVAEGSAYTYKIVAQSSTSGETVAATTRIRGIVDKANLNEDDPTLYIGSLTIPLSEVSSIALAEN